MRYYRVKKKRFCYNDRGNFKDIDRLCNLFGGDDLLEHLVMES